MTQIEYIEEVPPRRFRLGRANREVVETTLIGTWHRIPVEAERGDLVVGWKVRLKDDREVPLDQLMDEWGETTLSTPDLKS